MEKEKKNEHLKYWIHNLILYQIETLLKSISKQYPHKFKDDDVKKELAYFKNHILTETIIHLHKVIIAPKKEKASDHEPPDKAHRCQARVYDKSQKPSVRQCLNPKWNQLNYCKYHKDNIILGDYFKEPDEDIKTIITYLNNKHKKK